MESIRHYARYAVNILAFVIAVLTLPELGGVIGAEHLPFIIALTATVNTVLSWMRGLV